jgi:hypothetical protein
VTQWLWTAADGSTTDLSAWSANTYVVDTGTTGILAPEYEFATQSFAGIDGATVQQITAQPAAPVLGLDLVGSGTETLAARVRALAHALRPRAGIGTLTAIGAGGVERRLRCYYRKGLESGVYRDQRYRTALEFWAPSSWWRGDVLRETWSLTAPAPFFPVPPVRLSATTLAGSRTVDLSGCDSPTFPLWIVTGPGSHLALSNSYTARQPDGTDATVTLDLDVTPPPGSPLLGDGQHLAIDTRPGRQSVRRVTLAADGRTVTSYGESLFGWVGTDPAMWPLVDGVNEVTATLGGAGAASRITLEADRLYSGAL